MVHTRLVGLETAVGGCGTLFQVRVTTARLAPVRAWIEIGKEKVRSGLVSAPPADNTHALDRRVPRPCKSPQG